MLKINQIISSLSSNDAAGNEVLMVRDLLRKLGHESNIYAWHASRDLNDEIIHFSELKNNVSNIIIYHYCGIDDIYKHLCDLKSKKILIYHNITPSHFFNNYDERVTEVLKEGRDKLNILSDMFDLTIAKSNYSKQELTNIGFKNIEVIPYIIKFDRYNTAVTDIKLDSNTESNHAKILFVGRVAPNKMIQDLIMVFYYYTKCIDPLGKLIIVGNYSGAGCRTYHFMLQKFIKELNIEYVYFTNGVSISEVGAYYNWANMFITMSQHEGFCIPLVESMYFGLPIIANNACAIPETLAGSGILVNNRNYAEIAELVQICIENKEFRNRIISKEKERLKDFNREKVENIFRNCTERVL